MFCCHLTKNHQRSNAIVERGPFFCVLSYKKKISVNKWVLSMFSRVTSDKHVPLKSFDGHCMVHFLETPKGRDAHPKLEVTVLAHVGQLLRQSPCRGMRKSAGGVFNLIIPVSKHDNLVVSTNVKVVLPHMHTTCKVRA